MKFLRDKIDLAVAKDILRIELTQYEFAESLAMRSDSLFVNQMFDLVDKDNNGYISFREFLDMMVIFAKGIVLLVHTPRAVNSSCCRFCGPKGEAYVRHVRYRWYREFVEEGVQHNDQVLHHAGSNQGMSIRF